MTFLHHFINACRELTISVVDDYIITSLILYIDTILFLNKVRLKSYEIKMKLSLYVYF